MQHQNIDIHGVSSSSASLIFPHSWSHLPIHNFNSTHLANVNSNHEPIFIHPNSIIQSPYARFGGSMVQPGPPADPFGLEADFRKMTAKEIMDAKALAASKNHSEAERRRRERINNHLAKLRSLLPSNTKTDKASLLAEVIQHVKDLKRQTSIISETSAIPTEVDELTILNTSEIEDGKFVIKATLCCEDRSDLLPEIIKALKDLKLKTLKAEITTLGGRVRNVFFITGDQDNNVPELEDYVIGSIQEALKSVMERNCRDDQSSSGSLKKRQRTNVSILEQQHRFL